MPAANRPPRDITPQRFFEEWLPAEFARQFASGVGTGGDLVVRVTLDGDDGGSWDLEVRGGRLAVQATVAGALPSTVTVLQTVRDWRAVTVGEDGAIDLTPPQASPLDVLFVDPISRQILASARGTLRFQVTGVNGRTWMLTVCFGAPRSAAARGVSPDATVTIDADTYAGLLARRIPAPEAFFGGKIQLSGDAGLAMQLGMAMLPRFV